MQKPAWNVHALKNIFYIATVNKQINYRFEFN